MKKLYSGVVSIRVTKDGTQHQHNTFYTRLAETEDAALGAMIKDARARHPQGAIVNSYVYEIDAGTIRVAYAELTPEAT